MDSFSKFYYCIRYDLLLSSFYYRSKKNKVKDIFNMVIGLVNPMGKNLKRNQRLEKRKKKQIRTTERSLGISTTPKKCPICGTQMELKIPPKPKIPPAGQRLEIQSTISAKNFAESIPMFICPRCEFRMVNID